MANLSNLDVLVVGAGVSGLTTAMTVAEAGASVHVVSDTEPASTTSACAGAVWGPYAVGSDPRILAWSLRTLERLRACAEEAPGNGAVDSGVRFVPGLEASQNPSVPPPWAEHLPDFAVVEDEDDLPDSYVSGWRYTVPIVIMPIYLDYLRGRLAGMGVDVVTDRHVESLKELEGEADVVVNCTGLAARELVPDPAVYPIMGQLVVVTNPGVTEFFSDYPESTEPTYFMPQDEYVVLGGTIVPPTASLDPDPETTAAIVKRCAIAAPALLDATVVEERVGLRPARDRVCVEAVEENGMVVVHNYGHGGSGVTLSWGCAEQVVQILA